MTVEGLGLRAQGLDIESTNDHQKDIEGCEFVPGRQASTSGFQPSQFGATVSGRIQGVYEVFWFRTKRVLGFETTSGIGARIRVQ